MLTEAHGAARARRFDWLAACWAGVAAAIASTVLQLLLWATVLGDFPQALFRDARLAAAIVMGRRVLPPPASFDLAVMLVATLVHFVLSLAYAVILGRAIGGLARGAALLAGAIFGLALYGVNLYGFTALFPWFAQVRTWDTLLAHLVFGLVAAGVYHAVAGSRAGRPAVDHRGGPRQPS